MDINLLNVYNSFVNDETGVQSDSVTLNQGQAANDM